MSEDLFPLGELYGFTELIEVAPGQCLSVTHQERPSARGTLAGVLERRRVRLEAGVPLPIVDRLWQSEGGPALAMGE